ncbi:hypothetical protein KHQ81_13000 [Mycoplasmatota bacterium]|nr:hypothetical protein KHQ81_13000 [Mycoplasmatota bacterium]
MRKETICLSERNLMFAIAGQLYDQAPNRQPRKADVIMKKVKEAFRKIAYNSNEFYTCEVDSKKLNEFIHNLLFSIDEFRELNLSQTEFDAGVKVDDPNRGKYKFTSRYDVETPDSWKTDFIDLDAFERNVLGNLYMLKHYGEDCFCCTYEGTEKCNSCKSNPKFGYHYKSSREPRGKYTFACQFDCFKSRYICCEECDEKNMCSKRCESKPDTCVLALKESDSNE